MAIDLDELERLAKEATPLPWVGRGNHIFCADKKRLAYVEAERALDLQTAAYIVAACNSLPTLIAENRKFQECTRELSKQNDFFLKALKENFMCPYSRCKYDDGSFEFQEWECDAENNRECWIKAAKEAEE